jgi:hypothetical protein
MIAEYWRRLKCLWRSKQFERELEEKWTIARAISFMRPHPEEAPGIRTRRDRHPRAGPGPHAESRIAATNARGFSPPGHDAWTPGW